MLKFSIPFLLCTYLQLCVNRQKSICMLCILSALMHKDLFLDYGCGKFIFVNPVSNALSWSSLRYASFLQPYCFLIQIHYQTCDSAQAHSLDEILWGRFLVGLGVGVNTVLVPIYISEVIRQFKQVDSCDYGEHWFSTSE